MQITVSNVADELARAISIEDRAPVGSSLATSAASRAARLEDLLKHTAPASLDECLSALAVAAALCDDSSVPASFKTALAGRADVGRIVRGVIAHLIAAGAKSPLGPSHLDGLRFDDFAIAKH